MKLKWLAGLSILTIAASCTGCGSGDSPGGAPDGTTSKGQASAPAPVSTEPVTLNILASTTELNFEQMLIEPVKKKYPHITLNIIQKGKGASIPEMVVTGEVPDLFTDWTGGMKNLMELDVFYDMTPLIKQQNIDLSRIQTGVLDSIKVNSNGGIYGLPFNSQLFMMLYNKDIFNKFGVPYPKDGMTWTETVELAKKVTRMDGGTQYRGLDPDGIQRVGLSRSQIMVDAKTNKSNVNNEEWK
jgi:ABC-type glycerol-3-phosphate transport system substrate-binding protein